MITIPGYRPQQRIYEGANSVVLRAERRADGQTVILKILKRDYPTPGELSRYRHEFEVIRHLDCDSVCRVIEFTQYDNSPVLVLEDFGGEALSAQIPPDGMSAAEVLEHAMAIVEHLGEIHRRNVIHKDINPSNIVFNRKTGVLKIIDFGISGVLTVESPTIGNPSVLEGTLPYLSPEQTGRMNRSLDYRSDFYSLGVTLYEMLTGRCPFTVTDPVELVACHIARQPALPHEVSPDLPRPLSELIGRLLAKNAEDRYQSTHGLLDDLTRMRQDLREAGTIAAFTLGQSDVTGVFQLPQKLYGREREIEALLSACARVCRGDRELVLVAGYSGIGKSALIKELYRPLTELNGYFVGGKYEQYQRNIPYSALVAALSELVRQLLAEPEQQLQQWREQLLAALAGHGRVLIDVIADLELVIGPQPEVDALPPVAARHRFNRLLQRFVRTFCRASHPLVIFLDDLQWADVASLQFIEMMLLDEQSNNLLLVGAYRDNEVGPNHPLTTALERLEQEGGAVSWIRPAALDEEHVRSMLADTLAVEQTSVASLAELVLSKTGGNPFFVNQFLRTLHQKGLIAFDHVTQRWSWDTAEVREQGITDNVVQLMVTKLTALPDHAQTALQLASCLGHRFELGLLSTINGSTISVCAAALRVALDAGLIIPTSSLEALDQRDIEAPLFYRHYRFLHDRVQQAAYATIVEPERAAVHLRIGRLFLSKWSEEQVHERVFDVVNQLNHSVDLIEDVDERLQLARLNHLAGSKALQSAAFASGYDYFMRGIALLPEDCWTSQYRLSVELHSGAAEAASLNLDYQGLEAIASVALVRIEDVLDKVPIRYFLGQYFVSQVKLRKAASAALQTLSDLGEALPLAPTDKDFERAFAHANTLIDEVGFAELTNLPRMVSPKKSAAMMIVRSCMTPSFFGVPELLGLVICRFVELTLTHGRHPLSAYGFITFSCLLNAGMGDIERGKQFAEMGIEMFRRQSDQRSKAAAYCFYWGLSRHFYAPIRESIEPLMEGYHSVIENGDNENSLYCLINAFYSAILSGHNLREIQERFDKPIQHAVKFKQNQVFDQLYVWRQVVENLMGRAEDPAVVKGEFYDAEGRLPELLSASEVLTAVYVGMCAMMVYFHFGRHDLALAHAQRMDPNFGRAGGKYFYSDYAMYYSLSMTALYLDAPAEQQRHYLQRIRINQQKLKKWASFCEENFHHKFLLVEAELARVQGRTNRAMELYDQAIEAARRAEHIHNAALAAELAGRFWQAEGRKRFAKVYMTEACNGFRLWGAEGKAQYLQQRHPDLIMRRSERSRSVDGAAFTTTVSGTSSTRLDLVTVLKAAQAVSGEIVLERLVTALMNSAIENAGAQRGLLFLRHGDELRLEAEGAIEWEQAKVLQAVPLAALDGPAAPLCVRMAEYVARTLDSVVLADATNMGRFTQDAYVLRHQPRSVLCTPIVHKGDLVGLLYLENNIATNVFTRDRLELLRLLSSQMAISIENSRLYSNLEERVEERSRQLEQAHARIVALERETIEKQMAGGFAHEIRNALSGAELVLSKALGADERQGGRSLNANNAVALQKLQALLRHRLSAEELTKVDTWLATVTKNQDKIDRILQLAHQSAARGLLITKRILDYSKIGEEHAGNEPLDLNELARKVVSEIEPELVDNEVSMSLELRDEPLWFQGNDIHFHSAIGILLGNARDAVIARNGSGTSSRRIRLVVERTPEHCFIRVIDNGEGIPSEDRERVFEPFFSTRPDTGLGLGLGFAQKIVSLYGGRLELRSRPGVETVATITLPMSTALVAE